MFREKDPVWDHAVYSGNGRFKCNFCEKEFPGGSSRIKSHLFGIGGHDIEICPKAPKDIQLRAQQGIDTQSMKFKSVADSSCVQDGDFIPSSSSNFREKEFSGGASRVKFHCPRALHPKSLPRLEPMHLETCQGFNTHTERAKTVVASSSVLQMPNSTRKEKSEVDKLFIMWAANHPNAVESEDFVNFIDAVVDYGLDYKLPNIRKELEEYVQNALTSAIETGCTLIYYGDHNNAWVVFAHTPNGAVFIDLPVSYLEDEPEKFIYFPVEGIGVPSVVQFIIRPWEAAWISTPKGTRDVKDVLSQSYPRISQVPCATHEISNVLHKVLSVDVVLNTMRIVTLIDCFCNEYKIGVLAREVQGRRRYSTAWRIGKLLLLLEVESDLQNLPGSIVTLSSERWKLFVGKEARKHSKAALWIDYLIHCKGFWSRVEIVADIIRPLIEAIFLAYGDSSSLGKLYEAIENVKAAARKCCEKEPSYFDRIQKILDDGIRDIIQPIHAGSAFLNPIYMYRRGLEKDEEMTAGLKYILERVVEVDEKEAFEDQVQKYVTLLNKCREENMTLNESHPRTWWNLHGNNLPVLQKYAIRILSQPCGSSFHHSRWRSRSENASSINIILMGKYKYPEEQMSESNIFHKLTVIFDEISEDHVVNDYSTLESCIRWIECSDFASKINDPTCSWLDKSFENEGRLEQRKPKRRKEDESNESGSESIGSDQVQRKRRRKEDKSYESGCKRIGSDQDQQKRKRRRKEDELRKRMRKQRK